MALKKLTDLPLSGLMYDFSNVARHHEIDITDMEYVYRTGLRELYEQSILKRASELNADIATARYADKVIMYFILKKNVQ